MVKEGSSNLLPADRLINYLVSNLWELDIVALPEPACGKPADPWRGDRVELTLQNKRGYITDNRLLEVQRPISCDPSGANVPVVSVEAKVGKLRMV